MRTEGKITVKGCPIEAILEQTKTLLEILTQILKHCDAMVKECQKSQKEK